MKTLAALIIALAVTAPTPAHAGDRYRKYDGVQSGEVVVCYSASGVGTYAVSRKSTKDGPDKWTTRTHCNGHYKPYGYRNGRWVEWHDRQTGEVLVCYGGVRIRPIEGAREGAQWAKCATRNLGKISG